MSRPSRNVDVLLLRAGRELFPRLGAAGLSVRKLADRAGVNPGMFHYHFRTKDAFVARLLQQVYDAMFANLELAAASGPAVTALHAALCVLGRFARDHAPLLRRLFVDALAGDRNARAFLCGNVPRHIGMLQQLIRDGQREGTLKPMPVAQVLSLLAGAVLSPLLVGSALAGSGLTTAATARGFVDAIASDEAIAERARCALAGIRVEAPVRRQGAAPASTRRSRNRQVKRCA